MVLNRQEILALKWATEFLLPVDEIIRGVKKNYLDFDVLSEFLESPSQFLPYATLMMANNISPKIASSMLGHANISTTMDLYSHVMVDMKKEATEAISKIIDN